MIGICSSPLWDSNLTWYTHNPDLTSCFQDTLLTWVPCGLFILFLPYDIYLLTTKNNGFIRWNFKNVTKIVCLSLLIFVEFVDLFEVFIKLGTSAELVAREISFISMLVTHIIILIVMILNRRKGIQTSGNIFTFWCLWLVVEFIRYRSAIFGIYRYVYKDDILGIGFTLFRFPLVSAIFLLGLINDGDPLPEYDYNYHKLPKEEENSSVASYLMFWWIVPLMRIGAKRTVVEQDVNNLSPENRSDYLSGSLERFMNGKKGTSIYYSIMRVFGPGVAVTSLVLILQNMLVFLNPIIMSYLMDFVKSDQELWKGIFFSFSLLVVNLVKTLFNERCVYSFFLFAMQIKSALIAIIYKKSMRLSCSAKQEWTSGEVVNLVSVDVQRVQECVQNVYPLFTGVVDIAVAMYFLVSFLGLSSLAGIAVFFILIPLNSIISKVIGSLQTELMKLKDGRIKMIAEVLGGMKVLKLYAWEQPFEDLISKLRSVEVVTLRKSLYVESAMVVLFVSSPFFVSLFTFVSFTYGFHQVLTPNIAFVSLALFNIIRIPMGDLPYVVGLMVKSCSSMSRIVSFMKCEELEDDVIERRQDLHDAIKIKDGFFSWEKNGSSTLKYINLRVPKGKLVAIVGQIGSGKSSLISSILGEMYKDGGTVNVDGRLAYVPQQAWILNDTVKNNILFNVPTKKKKYDRVIEKCALKSDFQILPAGDQTEIGEKGVNLSGGQKQRVSLARAVYKESDIYLLDDPLSAVDSHVGKHIFSNVIGPTGVLKNKTRLLVTHGLKYLPECDYIYMMKNGEVVGSGTYCRLMEEHNGFADLMNQYMENKAGDQEEEYLSESEPESFTHGSKDILMKNFSSEGRHYNSRSNLLEDPLDSQKPGKLIDDEEIEEGRVSSMVYAHYFKNIGLSFVTFMITSFGLFNVFDVAANEWLSAWSSDSLNAPDGLVEPSLIDTRVGVYSLFGILQGLSFAGGMFMFTIGATSCASKSHSMMLSRIMRAPMSLFDTTPLGRLLNRFSRDINTMDTTLVIETAKLVFLIWRVIGAIVIICMNMPPFIVVAILVTILYVLALIVSVRSLRQLMRLESVYRSPVYSHVQESISGASSIRAYDVTDTFIDKMYQSIDYNHKFLFSYNVINSWLSVILQTFGAFVVFFTALVAVLLRDSVDSATVGLTINYALSVTLTLCAVVKSAVIVEANIVSVERILEYIKLPQEATRHSLSPTGNWPSKGNIVFESYRTSYREGLDLVLKGINVDIAPSEKVGIVGRTGAGKSSLTMALFRIIEPVHGRIIIDGVDISRIGLHDLRSKLTIIPQDPVLFSGTFRMNIDPFGDYTDQEVWLALEHAHLKKDALELSAGLDYRISEGGQNFSVGQRQLICLARALLRNSKILILDEATAAIDLETDDLIQQTIRKQFKDCTILTIAHRLNTILDCDRLLVFTDGKISESGSPAELMSDSCSTFHSMSVDAGLI